MSALEAGISIQSKFDASFPQPGCCFLMVPELSGLVVLEGNSDKKPLAVKNAWVIFPVAVSIPYRKGIQGRKGGK